ncbi:MAG TPA: hypothetical protein VF984_00935 [Actinomycetota bacterium]
MRTLRVLTMILVVGTVSALPGAAAANGGAYISLNRTHYLPGQTAVATTYVSVPERERALFDRGPFYAYVLMPNTSERGKELIGEDSIRVGTFTVRREKGSTFELRASFPVPDLPGAFYTVALCNDPCTISGFREPLTGSLSIVHTEREGVLLTQRSRLQGRIFALRRQLRKAERSNEELQTAFDQGAKDREWLANEVNRLNTELTEERALPTEARRPLVGGWAVAAVVAGLLAVALALWRRRRASAIRLPDTA